MSIHPEKNYFKEYKKDSTVFVETGTYRGDAMQHAFDANYNQVFSIDIDPGCKSFCSSRFAKRQGEFECYTGDSATDLFRIIENIKEKITFWLDGHWQMFENTDPGENPFPLLHELSQIQMHIRNDHTIFIDDMLIMQSDIVGYNKVHIEKKLLQINPKYKFKYLPNPVINGILVAYI